ncbi:MAG: T9SS type A sorting domain-containing protein [Lewinellaceae bacterium]|nr:T9SS type A sorting domain-containing protein [Saprospiraceae bacterium]MCB9342666.1 T9SS type A sorting domain-containing protein [Lewinellaceae bacterium]
MTKMLTFRSLLLALLLATGSLASFAQTPFWTETFSDSGDAYANWDQTGTNDGLSFWEWTDVINAGNWQPGDFTAPSASTGYMWFDSDANGETFPYDLYLTGNGNPADCSGKSNVHLRFYTYFRTFTGTDLGAFEVSTDGGANWTVHSVPEFDALEDEQVAGVQIYQGWIDQAIPEADGAANVLVRFHYMGQFEYYWKIDDIEMYEYSTPTYDVTFRVNMLLETVDPMGVYIAGNFTSNTPTAMTDAGNGVWEYTASILDGEAALYIFMNGPVTPESVPAACGIDPGVGTNVRFYTVSGDATLSAVCFGECAPCVVPCSLNPDAIICDDLDSYDTAMKLGPQATWWTTWSGAEGTTEDGIVTTEQANTMPNSFKIVSTAANGGPQDVVLDLGNKTTGNYELKWKEYVPAGRHGYYNIQDVVPIGNGSWNLDVFFEDNQSGHVQIGAGASLATFAYPNDQWFEVRQVIDLDNNFLTLWVDGNFVIKMAYPNNLGGIDFFGTDAVSTYYVDDVEYVALPPVVYNVDICDAAVDLTSYFGAAPGVAQTTGIYDNTNATVSPTDPEVTCWTETPGADIVDGSMWYTFVGDGNQYHIETVPCNATNYIGTVQQDPGDTQMLIYAGDDCEDLTEIACADDLFPTGDPDWRAGLDLQTDFGQNYYMLIDGFNFQGTVALGEFCVEITQVASVTCADGVVGTYDVPNPYLCFEAQLADLIFVDDASFVLPTEGPVSGLAWALSSSPVPAGTWPSDAAGYLGSTSFLDAPFAVGYQNLGPGSGFPYGVYFVTPVVLGGGTLIDPAGANQIQNVDATTGCFFVGASTQMFFLPLLDDITATFTVGSGSVDLTPAGGLGDVLGDPSVYMYEWSNGATTQDLSGVAPGTYTCTVTDASGCALEAIVTATVTTSGTNDPASVQAFTISPNPTSGRVMVNLALADASDVRIDVLSTLGQTVQSLNFGKVNLLNEELELGNLPQGSYFLRVTIDGETAVRRVVVQH